MLVSFYECFIFLLSVLWSLFSSFPLIFFNSIHCSSNSCPDTTDQPTLSLHFVLTHSSSTHSVKFVPPTLFPLLWTFYQFHDKCFAVWSHLLKHFFFFTSVTSWIPGCVEQIYPNSQLHHYWGWQFYNYASGHTNPNDLVTVSPATNEGSVIMHDRGGFTSGWPDYWAWGRHHQPVTNNGHVQVLCSCHLVIFQYSLPAYGMRPPNFSKPSGISKGMLWGQEDIMHNFLVLDYPASWHKLLVIFPGLFGGERQSRQSRHSRVLLCSLLLSNLEAAVRLCKPSTTKAGWGGGSWREYGELMATVTLSWAVALTVIKAIVEGRVDSRLQDREW